MGREKGRVERMHCLYWTGVRLTEARRRRSMCDCHSYVTEEDLISCGGVLPLWALVSCQALFLLHYTTTTMPSLLHRIIPFRALLQARNYSQPAAQHVLPAASPSSSSNLSYFVPRNSNGNLPVYSDIRNNGTRYFILIRNVDGQAHVSAAMPAYNRSPRI